MLAHGIKGKVTLHDGPTRKPRTVVNIEKAAPWCVGSNLERYKWKAPEVSNSSPHTGEDGYLVLPTMTLISGKRPGVTLGKCRPKPTPQIPCHTRTDIIPNNLQLRRHCSVLAI